MGESSPLLCPGVECTKWMASFFYPKLAGGWGYIYGEPIRSDLCPIEQMSTLLDFLVHLFQQMPVSTHFTENRRNNERKAQ